MVFDLASTNWVEFLDGASGNFKNQVEPPSSENVPLLAKNRQHCYYYFLIVAPFLHLPSVCKWRNNTKTKQYQNEKSKEQKTLNKPSKLASGSTFHKNHQLNLHTVWLIGELLDSDQSHRKLEFHQWSCSVPSLTTFFTSHNSSSSNCGYLTDGTWKQTHSNVYIMYNCLKKVLFWMILFKISFFPKLSENGAWGSWSPKYQHNTCKFLLVSTLCPRLNSYKLQPEEFCN